MLDIVGAADGANTDTAAEADFVGSAADVAVTLTEPGVVVGATYVPGGQVGKAGETGTRGFGHTNP